MRQWRWGSRPETPVRVQLFPCDWAYLRRSPPRCQARAVQKVTPRGSQAVPVVALRAAGRAAIVAGRARAGGDRDVATGRIAGGGAAGQLLCRARISVVG